ncbi:hypothetical protein AVEN_159503-1 [Araneus ventricosus]|uniref:Uncharacterized protein n=1 Tax=Araneus ventricosus TaxID=182803 RepID=A0A4Y2A2B8_ARAVE|nr:hypothetical protein AVEN_159503-1 [Araneus ventricosus]
MVSTLQDSTSDIEKSSATQQCSKAVMNDVVSDLALPEKATELGLKKQFVKGLNADGECQSIQPIVSSFPALCFEKIKVGVFDMPQIRIPL